MKKTVKSVGVVGQIRIAMSNPAALVMGALLGGIVPVASYHLAHHESKGWDLALLLVLGGLVYSAKTVWAWGKLAFDCSWKATGFVLLIEGVMVTSKTPWLAVTALAYLVAINAIASGCSLALRDMPAPEKKSKKSSAMPSEIPAAPSVPVFESVAPAAPKKVRRSKRAPAPVADNSNNEAESVEMVG